MDSFLGDGVACNKTINTKNNEENSGDNSIDQTTDDEISQPASTSEHQFTTPNPTNATRKRRLRDLHSLVDKVSCINNTMNTASSQSTTEHEFDHFAKSVAGQLKAMPLLSALEAQKHIQNYLSDMRIQQLMNSSRTPSPMNNSSNRIIVLLHRLLQIRITFSPQNLHNHVLDRILKVFLLQLWTAFLQ